MKRRQWLGITALLGAGAVAASLATRGQLREAAGAVGPRIRSVGDDAGRVLSGPTEEALDRARSRLVPAMPLPADTKWRTLATFVRGAVNAAASAEQSSATAVLYRGGLGLVQTDGPLSETEAAETLRRATQSLGIRSETRRRDGDLLVVASSCELIANAEAPPRVCDVTCGAGGLLSGVAARIGRSLEATQRLGDGADHCELRFLNTAAPSGDSVG